MLTLIFIFFFPLVFARTRQRKKFLFLLSESDGKKTEKNNFEIFFFQIFVCACVCMRVSRCSCFFFMYATLLITESIFALRDAFRAHQVNLIAFYQNERLVDCFYFQSNCCRHRCHFCCCDCCFCCPLMSDSVRERGRESILSCDALHVLELKMICNWFVL